MKKFLCILLCGAVCLALLSGCGREKEDKKYTTDVDVEYYVRQGQIPECGKYSLGAGVDDIISEFDALQSSEDDSSDEHNHDEDEFFYFLDEQTDFCGIRTGSAEYCYKPNDRENGITAIVSFGNAFGFMPGDIIIEIKQTLSDYSVSETVGGNGLPFLSTDTDTEYLTYKFADRAVTFAFYNNEFCGAAVYSVKNWSLN